MNTEPDKIDPADREAVETSRNQVSKWGTVVGIVLMVLGLASLMMPGITALAIEVWLAISFLIVGAALLFQAVQNKGHGSIWFEIIWGMIYLMGGATLLLLPKSGIITIALILGVVFVLDGIGRIMFASQAFADQRKTWWIVDGVLAIVLGGIILANWPGDSAWIIGVLVGLRLLITGLVTLVVANMLAVKT
jgi:uncharacterized membrane protein HdeD (DUF308 family)